MESSGTGRRRLVVCCDGTWNQPEKSGSEWEPKQHCTNVLKTVRAVRSVAEDGTDQVTYYERGVGTGGFFDKFVGGFAGYGINRNIEQAYSFLANNYCEGDELWCFGFSRGAYTVRSLIGFVNTVGLVPPSELRHLPSMYEYYRLKKEDRDGYRHAARIRELSRLAPHPPVKFMGVWDTVGALGAPTPLLGLLTRWLWVGFHDTTARNIRYAYHALAIDEQRKPFAPSVWTEKDDVCLEMKQVWFPGAHSNVGGGYPDASLSDLAFVWMMRIAQQHGLGLIDGWDRVPDEIDPRWDVDPVNSFKLMYRVASFFFGWRYQRPLAGELRDVGGKKVRACEERIHESAVNRFREKMASYNPENLAVGVERLPVEE